VKYCEMNGNTNFNIIDLNWKELSFEKQYVIRNERFGIMKSILNRSFCYHGRSKTFVKMYFNGQILFSKKLSNNKIVAEFNMKCLNAHTMTKIKILNEKSIIRIIFSLSSH
jgi:hypothetical protein